MTDSHLPVIRCVSRRVRSGRRDDRKTLTVAICYRRNVVTVKCHKSLVKHRDYRFPSTIYAAACAINLSIVARARKMLSNLEEGHLLCAHMFARVVAFLPIRSFAAFSATGMSVRAFFLFVFFSFREHEGGSLTDRPYGTPINLHMPRWLWRNVSIVSLSSLQRRESSLAKLGIWFYTKITRSIFPGFCWQMFEEKKMLKVVNGIWIVES